MSSSPLNVTLLSYSQINPALLDEDCDAMPFDVAILVEAEKYRSSSSWSDTLIEFAGRVCAGTVGRLLTNDHFIRSRLDEGHRSILEHGHATFLVTGLSRIAMAQATRHRLHSFSVESQRMVSFQDGEVVCPPAIAALPEAADLYRAWVMDSIHIYHLLRGKGIRKEDARFTLPPGMATTLVVSANFSAWSWFLHERETKAAQWEIRALAEAVHDRLRDVAPAVFGS